MGKRGPVPGSESAKRIGDAMRGRWTKEHYQELGRAGGRKTVETIGPEGLREAGKKGGRTTVERYGLEHMREIASRGGSA